MGCRGWGHVEQPHLPGEQLLLQLLGQWTQEGPKQGQKTHLALIKNILTDVNGGNNCQLKKNLYILLVCVRVRLATSQMRLGS